jgi:hypothetical protein
MEEEKKDFQDQEVIITDLEPSELVLNLSNARRKAHLFFYRHRKKWKRMLFLSFFVVLVVGVLSIPPLHNTWWSKISGIPIRQRYSRKSVCPPRSRWDSALAF